MPEDKNKVLQFGNDLEKAEVPTIPSKTSNSLRSRTDERSYCNAV